MPSSSMNRPPPPGPPGTYRLRFGGGSEAMAAEASCPAERDALPEPRGLPLGRPLTDRRGVDGTEVMIYHLIRRSEWSDEIF
jgi:hypothetical protein